MTKTNIEKDFDEWVGNQLDEKQKKEKTERLNELGLLEIQRE